MTSPRWTRQFASLLKSATEMSEAVDAALQRIEEKLRSSGEREILSGQIGELVMRELKRLDKIAYIRFASVYRSFEDIAEFRDAINEVDLDPKAAKNSDKH